MKISRRKLPLWAEVSAYHLILVQPITLQLPFISPWNLQVPSNTREWNENRTQRDRLALMEERS